MFKKPKSELAYSEMTDNIYWYYANGKRKEVSKSFMYTLLLMAKKTGKGFAQIFRNPDDEDDAWKVEVRCYRIDKDNNPIEDNDDEE